MVMSFWSDGAIITAGSLNKSFNAPVLFGSSQTVGTNAGATDKYITSGTFHPNSRLLILGDLAITNADTVNVNTFTMVVSIGPSGTTPTLTTLGSQYIAGAPAVVSNTVTHAFVGMIGSTTVDNASVPALIRFSGAIPANLTASINNLLIMGCQ